MLRYYMWYIDITYTEKNYLVLLMELYEKKGFEIQDRYHASHMLLSRILCRFFVTAAVELCYS